MRSFVQIILTFTFIFLLTTLLGLLSLLFVLSKEPTKDILKSAKIYEYIAPVIQSRCIHQLSGDNSFYEQVLEEYIDEIITPEWIQNLGETMLDEGYSIALHGKTPADIPIDISILKNNYISVLNGTEVKDLLPKFQTFLPDSVSLTSLLEIDQKELQSLIIQLQVVAQGVQLILLALIFTLILMIVLFSLVFSKPQILSLFSKSTIFCGLFFTIIPFVFHFIVLSPFGFEIIMNKQDTVLQTLTTAIGLLLIERVISVWIWIGLTLLGSGFAIRLVNITVFERKENK
jgi:hypothetical protein